MTTPTNLGTICGKWNGRIYHIHKELGQGANGRVYLASHQGTSYAVKVGEDPFSISSEVNVLKQFGKARGGILGPSVFDVDDWEEENSSKPFYVMNVIEGERLEHFIQKRGKAWIPVFLMQLLRFLEHLHEQGWVFGDLKPDNLLITEQPPRIAWFDAGGMTKMGRAIKEYTEWYDRGFWQMGNRRAEPSYDLFSVSMIMLHLFTGRMVQPQEDAEQQLKQIIFHPQQNPQFVPFQQVAWKGLKGGYTTAKQMRHDLFLAWKQQRTPTTDLKQQQPRKKHKKKSLVGSIISFLFFTSFFFLLITLYLFSQTLF